MNLFAAFISFPEYTIVLHCIIFYHWLAVALTCYISHSAKHRMMADFDPSGSQNP